MDKHDPNEIYPNTVIYTDKETVSCENDHPKVFYKVPEKGYVVCNYCDIKFVKQSNIQSQLLKDILSKVADSY